MNYTNVTDSFTLDTNILIYAIDASDPERQRQADDLVERLIDSGGILPLQSLNEFYFATTKKGLLPNDVAQRVVERAIGGLQIISPSVEDLTKAMDLHDLHNVHFYDALLWMTARRAGCTIFLTEDGQFGRDFGDITLHNPFAPGFDLDRLLG